MTNKKIYFVLDTMSSKNGKHYPVICPIVSGSEDVTGQLTRWAGSFRIVNVWTYDTKKGAAETCELLRKHYKGFNALADGVDI